MSQSDADELSRLKRENEQLRDAVTIWQKLADERKDRIAAQEDRIASLSTSAPRGLAEYIGNRKIENTAPQPASAPSVKSERYFTTIADLRLFAQGITDDGDRELVQHAADVIETLSPQSETPRGDTANDAVSIPRDLADDLLAYGMVHTCNGVVYRKPHMERLRELDALLALRSNGGSCTCTEEQ